MENKNFYVYKHTNKLNNKIYIGITCQEPLKRWLNGKGYTNNDYFTKSITKYGWENFNHEILYKNLTKKEAEDKEQELIKMYKSNLREYGYNLDNGGKINRFTQETKNKISKSNKGKLAWNKGLHIGVGEKNNFYGKHHTEDTKRKISLANKGRKKTQEQKNKVSNSCKKTWKQKIANGYKVSDETRKKISLANKGRVSTFKGHHHTEESKQKLRNAHLGKQVDKKLILKMVEKNKKPIFCYDKNWNFIKEYESIIAASKELKIYSSNISRCLKDTKASAKGYKFKYKENNDEK